MNTLAQQITKLVAGGIACIFFAVMVLAGTTSDSHGQDYGYGGPNPAAQLAYPSNGFSSAVFDSGTTPNGPVGPAGAVPTAAGSQGNAQSQLAFTGSSSQALNVAGSALVIAGAFTVIAAKRYRENG